MGGGNYLSQFCKKNQNLRQNRRSPKFGYLFLAQKIKKLVKFWAQKKHKKAKTCYFWCIALNPFFSLLKIRSKKPIKFRLKMLDTKIWNFWLFFNFEMPKNCLFYFFLIRIWQNRSPRGTILSYFFLPKSRFLVGGVIRGRS